MFNRAMATNPRQTHARTVEQAAKVAEMLADRAAGMDYEAIRVKHGYKTRGGAFRAIQRALAETLQEPADDLRALERERLTRLYQAAYDLVVTDQPFLYKGSATGYINAGVKLAAIDRCLHIQERLARLVGLDAPVRHEVLTLDAIDAEIARLNAELARSAQDAATADAEGSAG